MSTDKNRIAGETTALSKLNECNIEHLPWAVAKLAVTAGKLQGKGPEQSIHEFVIEMGRAMVRIVMEEQTKKYQEEKKIKAPKLVGSDGGIILP